MLRGLNLLPPLALLAGAAVGTVCASRDLLSHLYTNYAAGQSETLLANKTLYRGNAAAQESKRILPLWESAVGLRPVWAEGRYNLGQAQLNHASLAAPEDAQIQCAALEQFDRASRLSPHQPLYHLAWADLLVQLRDQGLACPGVPRAFADLQQLIESRLAWARILAPLSISDLYWGAFVYLAIDDRPNGLEMLRLAQEINTDFTVEQLEYIYNLVLNPQDLIHVLPHRYPQIVQWINYYSANKPAEFLAWSAVFVKALDDALDEVEQRYKGGEIDNDLFSSFVKTMSATPLTQRSEALRKRFDALLAHIYRKENNDRWAEDLEKRSEIDQLSVLKAWNTNDRHPETTMLARWAESASRSTVQLDALGTALGIYVPRGSELSKLVLQSSQGGGKISTDLLQLLVSDDNLEFQVLYHGYDIRALSVDGKSAIVINFDRFPYRYLKIYYSGSNQKPKFQNSFASMIKAYGRRQQ